MAMQVGACCKSASAALPVVGLRAELSGDSAATSSSSRSRVGKRGDRGGALVVRASTGGNKFGSVSFFGQGVCNTARSSFAGDRHLTAAVWSVPHGAASGFSPMIVMAKPVIQFIRGINEQSIPDVRLTRSRDGSNGVANFVFDTPSVFDSSRELGDITGIYMIDDEGVLTSVDVSAKFVNGKPAKIEARYVMRNLKEWDRFMRFMERYAGENELGFVKS